MNSTFSKSELIEIEKQLSCPTGDFGIKVAENMNISNINMTLKTIETLSIQNQDSVLELGHGNCAHLSELLNNAKNINYTGLDISETMIAEAQKNNASLMKNHQIKFVHYDGAKIPFLDQSFSKIMTINTLYFWEAPVFMLNELYRVLAEGGTCAISFAHKEFMMKLPYVGEKFRLYSIDDVYELVELSPFEVSGVETYTEDVQSKTDEVVSRTYSIVTLLRE